MKILVINGPNINMLGIREPGIYGSQNFQALLTLIQRTADEEDLQIEQFQSNHEGAIVDKIQAAYGCFDGIVINPAAYTHTSVAILDALKAVSIPAVEVHISNVDAREDFRQISYAGMACEYTIKGQGLEGYRQAILYLKKNMHKKVQSNELHFSIRRKENHLLCRWAQKEFYLCPENKPPDDRE